MLSSSGTVLHVLYRPTLHKGSDTCIVCHMMVTLLLVYPADAFIIPMWPHRRRTYLHGSNLAQACHGKDHWLETH